MTGKERQKNKNDRLPCMRLQSLFEHKLTCINVYQMCN